MPAEVKKPNPAETIVHAAERITGEAAVPNLETETELMQSIRQIEQNGLKLHHDVHDERGLDAKIYHDSDHPRTLEKRARVMAKALGLSSETYGLVRMAIAYHDTVIGYQPADPTKLTSRITRYRGTREGDTFGATGNEGRSAELLESEMRNATPPFSEAQITIAIQAIHATYVEADFGPNFEGAEFEQYSHYGELVKQNPELGQLISDLKIRGITKGPSFSQVHLERSLERGEHVPREVIITALADLGAAGLASKEEFFKEGDEEMQEVFGNLRNKSIMHRLLTGAQEQDVKDREEVVTACTQWLDSQPGFAVFQALRFEKIIFFLRQQYKQNRAKGINLEEEHALRDQFNQYMKNIRAAADRAAQLKSEYNTQLSRGEKEAFQYLLENMHFELNQNNTDDHVS